MSKETENKTQEQEVNYDPTTAAILAHQDENLMSPEQMAEIEAAKDQELFGDHVKKIGGCAVVIVDDEVISLELPITYPQLLTAIIKKKYDTDQTEALVANYIYASADGVSPEKAAEYSEEYAAYQAWRTKAKAVAKEVMGIEA